MAEPVIPVILNPTSRAGAARKRQDAITSGLRARGATSRILLTQHSGHAVELARGLAADGAGMIVAAGGDGTVHEVANGILGSRAPCALAVLPLGTGNDFAKMIPGANALHSALDIVARPVFADYDVGFASWQGGAEFFINAMGTGIDVEVVRQLHRLPALPGPIKYLAALLRALAVYDPVRLSAQNGGRLDRAVMMMAVGNGICQGGGFYLTPNASARDGRLELCVVDALPLWKVPMILPRVLRGTHGGHPSVTMKTLEHVRFEANGAASLYFQLDGELREPATRFVDVAVRPGALRVATAIE